VCELWGVGLGVGPLCMRLVGVGSSVTSWPCRCGCPGVALHIRLELWSECRKSSGLERARCKAGELSWVCVIEARTTGRAAGSFVEVVCTWCLTYTVPCCVQVLERAATAPAAGYRFMGFAPHMQDFDPSADHFANMNRCVQVGAAQ
jgi:hypothetical protein